MNRKSGNRGRRPRASRRRRRGGRVSAALIVTLVIAAGAAIGIFAWVESRHSENRALLGNDKFYAGVFVDGIPLGGLTREQARQQVEARQGQYVEATAVTVTKGEQNWQLKVTDTDYRYDTDAVLEEAWRQGRTGTDRERLAAINALKENPIQLNTTLTCDPAPLEQAVRDLAKPFEKPAVNATYASHDETKPATEHLSFKADVPGERVDTDALWAAVQQEFANKTFGTVEMQIVPVEAEVKLADLQEKMKLVVSWRSPILDHSAPRLTNIKLASAAINGRLLKPGEVLSFNDATGERSAAKGYQVSHVINGGVTDNGLGGGVCQVSGTLWNAVVRADLEVVERLNHTLKSAYLNPGEDATVDYGHKDFKFKNNKGDPILLFLYVSQQKGKYYLYAEVYGVPLEDGVTIDLESKRTKTVDPPSGGPRYVPSDAVQPGTTEINQPKQGEYYTTYKIYEKNGKEINRVKLQESYYPSSGLVIVYNPKDGIPTPTPASTPTPSPAEQLPPPAVEPTAGAPAPVG